MLLKGFNKRENLPKSVWFLHLPAFLWSFGKFSFAHLDHLAPRGSPSFFFSDVYAIILLVWKPLCTCQRWSCSREITWTRREMVWADWSKVTARVNVYQQIFGNDIRLWSRL